MGLGTLNNRSAGETITANFFNDIHGAGNGDWVGRNSSGVPTAGQNLGTAGIPWGTVRATSLILNGNAVDTSSIVAPANRIVSGKTRATAGSNLPTFLVPDGAALEADLDASPTNLVVVINGATVTFAADTTKTGLTAGPTTNHTCLVNDVDAADQYATRVWGESDNRKSITIDTVGSEISALVGKWAAFKIAGTTDEYFLAFVKSATELSNCWRGFFYDSALAPIKPAAFSNNDTITLMKLTWWFVENDGSTIDVSYNNPAWSFTAPLSPVVGDYWYDLGNNQWKRYDGSSFQVINRTFIGWTIQDGTACVGARCVDFYADYKSDNTLRVEEATNEIVRAVEPEASVNVAGTEIVFGHDRPTWNITTDLAASSDMFDAAEQASRLYYIYVKQTGARAISDIPPFWRAEMKGRYHRYNTWRCVGHFFNDASSDIDGVSSLSFCGPAIRATDSTPGLGLVNAHAYGYAVTVKESADVSTLSDANDGQSFIVEEAGVYAAEMRTIAGAGNHLAGVGLNPTVADKVTNGFAALTQDKQACLMSVNSSNTSSGTGLNILLKKGDVLYGMVSAGAVAAADGNAGVRFTKVAHFFEG